MSTMARWWRFTAAGAAGFLVQLGTLALLTGAGLHYLPATAVAVEAAIVCNFLWHERWTWRDRPAATRGERWTRLARFNALTGLTSIVGAVALTAALVEGAGLTPLAANALAVGAISLLNFVGADTLVFRGAAVAVLVTLGAGVEGAGVEAATLKPKTAKDFARYAAAVEARTAAELRPDGPFLVVRHQPPAQAKYDLAALARGEVVVARGVPARGSSSEEIEIDGGMINHWRGAVYVPNVTLNALLDNLREPNLDKHKQADVLKSVVLERNGDSQKVLLRLKRTGIVTVVYDTEYDVTYQRISPTRAASRSISTRIVEIENAGTPQEKARPEGDDHGFMWRLNSYWRYEQMGSGVMVEIESLTLSRNVPFLLAPIATPIISHIARETLERTLASVRERFQS